MASIESIMTKMRRNPKEIRLRNWRHKVMLNQDRYTYRVTWSEEDEEYVGLCAEFPSLSWLDESPEAALHGIRQLVADVVTDLAANDEEIPEPIAVRQYSGKFLVRVPPNLHRRLALEAAEAGVSLNRLASAKLAQHD
jgi:predicted HicB family RNase H-like nuclease